MSQTTTMTVRISGALSEFVASNVGENGSHENISEYVRDQILTAKPSACDRERLASEGQFRQCYLKILQVVGEVAGPFGSRGLFAFLAIGTPSGECVLPGFDGALVVGVTFGFDAGEECFGRFKLVGVPRAPVSGKASLKGGLQQRLAIEAECGSGRLQALDPLVYLVEHCLDLLHDAALFIGRGDWSRKHTKCRTRKLFARCASGALLGHLF